MEIEKELNEAYQFTWNDMEKGRRIIKIELLIDKESFEKEISEYNTNEWEKVSLSSMGDNILRFGGENFVAALSYIDNDKACFLQIIPKENDYKSDMEYNKKLYDFLESVLMPYRQEHKDNIKIYLCQCE